MDILIISRVDLLRFITLKSNYCLLDVRGKDELVHGMIPTAKHVPVSELEEALELSPKEFKHHYGFEKPQKSTPVFVYCRTGGRARIAADILLKKGYCVRAYLGGIFEWSEFDSNIKKYGPGA